MRRTLILGTIGATALALGLGVGATLASGAPIPRTTGMTTMMNTANGGRMLDADDMAAMMSGIDVSGMMGAGGMDAMHIAMHDALSGTVSADVLAACDSAHSSMTTSAGIPSGHAAHHRAAQP